MKRLVGYVLTALSILLALGLLATWITQSELTQVQLAIKYWYLVLVMVVCAFSGGWLAVD